MRLKNAAILALSTTLINTLTGCSTVKNPSSSYSLQRFAVPEVAAESWQAEVNVGGASMHKVVLPPNKTQKPIFTCNESTKCKTEDPAFLLAGVSVTPGLAFYYNAQLNRVSATWQYAGAYAGQATTGNFSQALVLGYSQHKDHGNFGDATFIGGTNQTLSWRQSTSAVDFGWVGGYRLNSQWLVYGGPFVTLHDIDTSSFYLATGNINPVDNPDQNFKGKQMGANAAVQFQFFRNMNLNLELVGAKYRIDDVSKTDTQLNLMLGIHF